MKPIAIVVSFLLTLCLLCASVALSGTVTDIDGNVYQTVTIGTQEWMAENLKVTHFRNGDVATYFNYNNDVSNIAIYGRLYDWYTATNSKNIAPTGWHVPSDVEWRTLVNYLGGGAVAGGKLKEAGTTHWQTPNTGATNESGFSALPGGERYSDGQFFGISSAAKFCSSSEYYGMALGRDLNYSSPSVSTMVYNKVSGYSIRCVKDGCCTNTTGNVNMSGIVDLSDLAGLISYLTGGGYVLPCVEEANVNNSGIVDLSDLAGLISYLTGGGYVLPNCL